MSTTMTLEEIAQQAASAVRLSVDASSFTVQDLAFIAEKTTQKTYLDLVNSGHLSDDDKEIISQNGAGQINFC